MKILHIIFMTALLGAVITNAAVINFTVTFKDTDFAISKENGYEVVNCADCENFNLDGDIGSPQVLARFYNFIIPPNEGVSEITIKDSKYELLMNECQLFPVQPKEYYIGADAEWADPDSEYYSSSIPYPENPVLFHNAGYFEGANHIATIRLLPVFYVGSEKKLYYYSTIEFSIVTSGTPTEIPIYPQIKMRHDQDIYNSILVGSVSNPADINSWGYSPELADTDIAHTDPEDFLVYPFVIITRDSLVVYWASYADWLNRKGYRTGVISIETIVSYGIGDNNYINDDADLLRGYLKYAHEHGTSWVLMGGVCRGIEHPFINDETVGVPIRYVPGPYWETDINCNADYQTQWVIADIYFSELNTNWELDNDGHPGELLPPGPENSGDDIAQSLNPQEELFLGRLPVIDHNDISRWTDKILNYEQNPGNGDNSYLLTATASIADQWQQSNCYGLNRPYFPFYTLEALFEEPTPHSLYTTAPKGSSIIAQMSEYPGYINWYHHGYPLKTHVATNGQNNLTIFQIVSREIDDIQCLSADAGCSIDDLTNFDKPGFLFSCDCSEADFACAYSRYTYTQHSLGSAYVLAENKGGVGFIGTSRYSFVHPNSGGNVYAKNKFLLETFSGKAIAAAKVEMNNDNPGYELLMNWTILGSPEQQVWSETPKHLSAVPDYDQDIIHVYDDGVPVIRALVCFSSSDYSRWCVNWTNEQGEATIPEDYAFDITNQTYITITKYNYLPLQIIGAGPIMADKTWRGDILLYGDVEIPIGNTLVIKPGSTVMMHNAGITVRGNLVIEGEKTLPVSLTSVSEDPQPGDWHRLFIDEEANLEISYCAITYAQDAIVAINGSNVDMSNCNIKYSLNSAVTAMYPEMVRITDSDFQDNNHYAINVVSAVTTAQFSDNAIIGQHNIGIKYLGGRPGYSAQPLIEGNRIEYSPGRGLTGIYVEKDEMLDTPMPQIIGDTVRHFDVGILFLDTDEGTSIGPNILSESNEIGLYMERAYSDIIGSTGHGNSISNNGINMWGITTYGEVRWTAIENYILGGGGVEINDCYMDWGRLDDWGNNSIIKSPSQYYPYMYITESPTNPAIYNWWGTTNQAEIEEMVTECVAWNPFLNSRPLLKQRTENSEVIPMVTALFPAVPNPFNAESRIQFNLRQTARVKLTIFNILGQEIKTLCNMELLPGSYSYIWDGRDMDGKQVSSGVYLYSLRTPEKMITNKMVMLK